MVRERLHLRKLSTQNMEFTNSSLEGKFLSFLISKAFGTKFQITEKKNLKFVRRGTNSLVNKGDVVIALKPLKQAVQNSEIVGNAEKIVEQSNNVISASEVSKENLKIFLNRNLILSSILPLFIDYNYETKILDKYKICMFVSTQSENKSVTAHRCSLISLHLKRIFELNGATVHTFSDEEESREHCVGDDTLCYRICDNIDTTVKRDSHKLILCSSVLDKTKGTKLNMSLADYKRLLREELKCAVLDKVACLKEEVLQSHLSNLVTGCLNLQFLNVSHSVVVKVNVDGPKNTRESAFVLYNHARLCNLLNNFESLIIEGIIPSLPPVSAVDFTLLKHSEEWDLFWLFIHKYPELLREVSCDCMCNFDNKLEIISSFPSHTISKFLHRLSHCLSVYYSRVHILPPSKNSSSKFTSHLLPTLWARIYLLKCVFKVMKSSLQLLNITPPNVM